MRSSFSRFPASRPLRTLVLMLGALTVLAAEISAAPPTVSHLVPAGGQRGTKVTVTCTGTFTWPVQVWAPGLDVVVTPNSGKLEVSIPADLAADRVWLRLYSAEGTSEAMPFLIGSLPEVAEVEPNNTRKQSQAVPATGTTINGVLQAAGDVDSFAVELTAGQTLVAALDANTRLGSPMDAMLQVASPDGTVLAENQDAVGLDPRLAFTAQTTGLHLVRVFAFSSTPNTNIAFAGGATFVYRLTLTTGPFITHTIPFSVPEPEAGAEPTTVAAMGWNIPPGTRLPVVPYGGGKLGDHSEQDDPGKVQITPAARLGFAYGPQFAGSARVRIAPHPVLPELSPGNSEQPLILTPPIVASGLLAAPHEADLFHVRLQKGQQVLISAESNSLDLPVIPVLRLTTPTDALAGKIDPGVARETLLTHTAAMDGDYRLTVSDRYRHGGDRYFYRLTIRLTEPDFELSTAADTVLVNPDKPTELPITVARRNGPGGPVGPITIEVQGLPEGVTAPAVVSEPTGPTATKVTLVLSTTGPAFSGPVRIVGTAAAPREIKRTARTPARFGATFESLWLTTTAKP